MSVHYKFKSSLNYDTVTFDGLHISVSDLKKAIMQQKKIGKSSDFDLEITNAQTKQVYNTEEDLIPKNTSVVVCRVPIASGNKKSWERPELPLPDDDKPSGSIRFDRSIRSADLANSNNTEDDKVKAMINQSSQEYDPSKYVKSRSMTGPLPPTYTCYRCGNQGHWIKNCPTNNADVKRSTGIPRSFMVPVDGPEHKGALLTSSGEFAVPRIDQLAYKEVKKEKPPFMPEADVPVEPAAEIPEELLCMICNNLLQHAVLTPCCANSFCDDCIRQALVESPNHECPVCHEIDVLPNTVIPNRFLRTAVANFNGDTEVRRLFPTPPIPEVIPKIDSPQPSPDSTVETQPPVVDGFDCKVEIGTTIPDDVYDHPVVTDLLEVAVKKEEEISDDIPEETIELTQPGTPLADELDDDMSHPLPTETVDKEQYDDYHSDSYSHRPRESYEHDSEDASDHCQISAIETITFRKRERPSLMPRPNFTSNHHRLDHSDYDNRDNRQDYHNRYDHRNTDRPPLGRNPMRPHSRYERPLHNARYHHSDNNRQDYHGYKSTHNHGKEFNSHPNGEQSRRRPRYPSPPRISLLSVPPPYLPESVSSYPQPTTTPVPVAPLQAATHLPSQPTFPPQPPPPGASPIDTLSHIPPQPPPPGVGPLLPTPPLSLKSEPSTFATQTFKDSKSQPEEQSIDDRIEAFQRELEKRGRGAVHERSRSGSRNRARSRSRSTSHSRSYNSSKSWTRSASRSLSRSRSRSRSTYSSRRSRSRSFSRSRSHSRSKSRSITRSKTRSRSKSRSRSREKRRSPSRERLPTPYSRSHSASHSPSPRNFHSKIRRSPYPPRRSINPPSFTSNYTPQYTAPPVLPIPTPYPPVHIQSIHTIQPPPITHPIDHYPPERQRYPYPEPYGGYDNYQHQQKPYSHPRFAREHRNQRFEGGRGFHRPEEIPHRIPGWVGDRSRQDQKLRFRTPRDLQRKEIKELPKVPDFQVLPIRTQKSDVRIKESRDDSVPKKKEEKPLVVKHKKRHHRRTKEVKKTEKHEAKPTYESKVEEKKETSNLISIEVQPAKEATSKKPSTEQKVKSLEKKEKKHKHKKHKLLEEGLGGKKRKVPKKEKPGDEATTGKVKVKKRKNKQKVTAEGKKDKAVSKHQKVPETHGETINVIISQVAEELSEHQLQIHFDDRKISDTTESVENVDQDVEMELAEEQVVSDSETASTNVHLKSETVPEAEVNTDAVFSQDMEEEGVKEEEENVEEEEVEEEEEETPAEDVLRVEVPELSKWEREEYEEDTLSRPFRKSTVYVTKEEKGPLSSDIIQRAENLILQKPLKTAIVVPSNKEKIPHKIEKVSIKLESTDKSSTLRTDKSKEHGESKPIPSGEKTVAPTLQVTISADKEKRSVQTKESTMKDVTKGDSHSKRVKLDRSHFSVVASNSKADSTSHRTVVVEHSSSESKRRDERQRANTERVKSRSSDTKAREKITYSRKDEYTHTSDHSRDPHHRDRKYLVEERRQKESHDSRRQSERYERSRHNPSDHVSSRDRRHVEPVVSYRSEERRDAHYRRSRSRSSSESYEHKQRSRKMDEPQYERSYTRMEEEDDYERNKVSRRIPRREPEQRLASKRDTMRDVTRTHTRQISHDESKFEPNYDEFSEDEPESKALPEKHKRPSDAPEISVKRLKHEKAEKIIPSSSGDSNKEKHHVKKSSSPSSVTSSSPSDSESSEVDTKVSKSKISDADHKAKHKKSRHKKHKKHKHKHKKKKSHKSKQKD